MKYGMMWLLATAAAVGICAFVKKREPVLSFGLKRFALIMAAGNLALILLAFYKEQTGGYAAIWYFGLWSYLLCLTLYDLKFKELPDWFHLLLLLFYGVNLLSGKQPVSFLEGGIFAFLVGAISAFVYLLRRDAIGLGDMKLMAACGIYAGMAVTGMIIRGMFAAFLCSILLLLFKKATVRTALPFVPFLLIGALWI